MNLPKEIVKSSLLFGHSFIHQFGYRDKSVIMVIDRQYPILIKREDSISKAAFLDIIDTIYDFRSPFLVRMDKKLIKKRKFGIVSNGTFILCYLNIKKKRICELANVIIS